MDSLYLISGTLAVLSAGSILGFYIYKNSYKYEYSIVFPNKYAPVSKMEKVEEESSPIYTLDSNETDSNYSHVDIFLLPTTPATSQTYNISNYLVSKIVDK